MFNIQIIFKYYETILKNLDLKYYLLINNYFKVKFIEMYIYR